MADIEVEERQRALDEATAIAKACVDGKLTETQRIALAASMDAKLGNAKASMDQVSSAEFAASTLKSPAGLHNAAYKLQQLANMGNFCGNLTTVEQIWQFQILCN